MDELNDFAYLFKRLKLTQLYRIEEIVKQSIRETEIVLELTEMDRAKLRHTALTSKSTVEG
jgi:hypothetical protein